MSDGLAKMTPGRAPGFASDLLDQVLVLADHSLRSSASLPGGDLEVQVPETW